MRNSRLYVLIAIFLFVSLYLVVDHLPIRFQGEPQLKHRPFGNKWIYDYAGIVDDKSIGRIDETLRLLHKETDVEFLAVSVNSLKSEDINSWTNKLFQNWKIGRKTRGQKGLLLVVAVKEQKVRFEVGYDLEPILTDMFVGYVENEQMKPFFEEGRVGVGFEATIELIAGRLWENIKNYTYDPQNSHGKTDNFSGGAGAKRDIPIGSVPKQPKPRVEEETRKYFSAQSTPEETFKRYLEASKKHIKDPDLDIYTDETKDFWRKWTVTNAQQDNERKFDNVAFQTKIKGDYAVIYYPDKDLTFNPFFLKKSQEGWQLDFVTMSQVLQFNQNNFWILASTNHPYMFAFEACQIDKQGFVLFNNRSDADKENSITFYSPKAWALAVSALMMERNHDRHDTLSGKEYRDKEEIKRIKQLLNDWWNVRDRASLLSTLDWLKEEGHRKEFEEMGNFFSSLNKEQLDEVLKNVKTDEETKQIYFVIQNYNKLQDKSILGWDYGRYVFLCRYGYLVGYLDEKEAWEKIMPIARELQGIFDSWKDLGENYLLGREFWSAEQMRQDSQLFKDAFEKLLTAPGSPWKTCPWDMNLNDL